MIAAARDAFLDIMRDVVFAKVVHQSEGRRDSVYGHAVVVNTYKASRQRDVRGTSVFFHSSDQCKEGWKIGPFKLFGTEPVVGSIIAGWGTQVQADKRRRRDATRGKISRPVMKQWVRGELLLLLCDELKCSRRKGVYVGKEGDAALRSMFTDNDDAEACSILGNEDAVYILARILLAHDVKLHNLPHLRLDAPPRAFIFYLSLISGCSDLLKAHIRHAKDPDAGGEYTVENLDSFMKYMGINTDASDVVPELPDHIIQKRVLSVAGTLLGLTRRWTSDSTASGLNMTPFPMATPQPLTQSSWNAMTQRLGNFCCIPAPPANSSLHLVFCSTHEHDGKTPFIYTAFPVGDKCNVAPCEDGEYVFERCERGRRGRNVIDPYKGTMVIVCATPSDDDDSVNKFKKACIIDMTAIGGYLLDRKPLHTRLQLASRLVDTGVFRMPCSEYLTVMSASKTVKLPLRGDVWFMPRRSLPQFNSTTVYEHRKQHRVRARLNSSNEWVIDDDSNVKRSTCNNTVHRLLDLGIQHVVMRGCKQADDGMKAVVHTIKLAKSKDYGGTDCVIGQWLSSCNDYGTSNRRYVTAAIDVTLKGVNFDVTKSFAPSKSSKKREIGAS